MPPLVAGRDLAGLSARPQNGWGHARLNTLYADAGVRQVIAVIADAVSGASIALHSSCGFAYVGRLTGVGRKHDA